MNFLLFVFFSTMENFAVFTLNLTIFRFRIREHWQKTLFMSILLAVVSYLVRVEANLPDIDPIVMLTLFTCSILLILEIKPFFASIVSIIGYLCYALLQIIIILLAQFIFGIALADLLEPYNFDSFALQALSAGSALAISYYVFKKGWGFTFSFRKFNFKTQNLFFLAAVILSAVIVVFCFYFWYHGHTFLYYISIILMMALLLLLILSIRREKGND